jgi:hypothetical protein
LRQKARARALPLKSASKVIMQERQITRCATKELQVC